MQCRQASHVTGNAFFTFVSSEECFALHVEDRASLALRRVEALDMATGQSWLKRKIHCSMI